MIQLAKKYGTEWALANCSTYPELQRTNWVAAAQLYMQEHKDSLMQCIKMDDEIAPQVPFFQGYSFDFPLGGEFLQGHDVSSLIP